MDNKYLFAVVGGVFAFVWFWVGVQPYYATDGAISTPFLWTAVVVLALGGGDSDGSDLISVVTGSITGFIPKFIALLIAYVVGSAIYEGVLPAGDAFDYMQVVKAVGTLFASGATIILTVACLKKAS